VHEENDAVVSPYDTETLALTLVLICLLSHAELPTHTAPEIPLGLWLFLVPFYDFITPCIPATKLQAMSEMGLPLTAPSMPHLPRLGRCG
jgi:hypothetical protein